MCIGYTLYESDASAIYTIATQYQQTLPDGSTMKPVSNHVAQIPVWWSVLNAGWFGVLTGIIIGAIGLYFAWVFYKRAKPRSSLQIASDHTLLVGPVQETVAERLRISFDGKVVPQVTSAIIGLWNAGTTIFRAQDFIQKDPLKLQVKDGNILQVTLESVSRESINPALTIISDQDVIVSFDFFEPQDALTVRILHSGLPNSVSFSGTLIGLPQGLKRFQPVARRVKFSRYVDWLFFTILGSLVFAFIIYLWVSHGWRQALLVPLFFATTTGSVTLLVWLTNKFSRRWSRQVPKAILSNSKLRQRLELEVLFSKF